jgi:hypothetical protein
MLAIHIHSKNQINDVENIEKKTKQNQKLTGEWRLKRALWDYNKRHERSAQFFYLIDFQVVPCLFLGHTARDRQGELRAYRADV